MKSAIIIITALIFKISVVLGQCTNQVTNLSGTALVNGVTVTVTSSGTVSSNTVYCGNTQPYWIGGVNTSGGYTFNFSPPVSGVTLNFSAVSQGIPSTLKEVVQLFVNGNHYAIPAPGSPNGCDNMAVLNGNGDIEGCISCSGSGWSGTTIYDTISSLLVWDQVIVGPPQGSLFSLFICDPICTPPNIITSPDATICNGQSDTISVNVLGGTPPYTYLWSPAASLNDSTLSNPLASPSVTTTYFVLVTDSNGCSATDSAIVNVSAAPIAEAGADTTICSGQGVTLTATGGGTYLWNNSDTSASIMVTPVGTTTYSVTVTNNGCSASDNVTITVNPLPAADAGADTAICSGQNVTLTATGGGTYLWSNSATTSSITVVPLNTTTYSVTVNISGCTASDNVTVTVNAVPIAEAGADTTTCSGQSVTLTASGGGTYLWSNSAITSSITVLPLNTTTYSVTVNNGGCTAMDSVTVSVNAAPTANAGNDTTINIGGSAYLHGSGGILFSWSPSSSLSCSDCANPVANPSSTTTYVLVVSDANGCSDSDTVTVNVDFICGEVFVPNAFSPNADGQNELECVYGNCITTIYFAIYDRWGEKVFETTNPKECWDGTFKGKKLNTAVFDYYMKCTLLNGQEIFKHGNINLIR